MVADDFEFALINNFHQYDDNKDGTFDRVELEIKLCDPTKTLQANYPYLIRSKTTGKKEIEIKGAYLYATEEYSIDCSSVEFKYTFTGNYNTITDLCHRGCYTLNGGYLAKTYSSQQHLEPFRWTMEITARGSQYKDSPIIVEAANIQLRLWGDFNTTDIEDTGHSATSKPAEIYNINSIKCNSTRERGLYIMKMRDGSYKKVYIK